MIGRPARISIHHDSAPTRPVTPRTGCMLGHAVRCAASPSCGRSFTALSAPAAWLVQVEHCARRECRGAEESELFAPGKNLLVIYSMMFPRAADDTSPAPPGGQTALLPLAEGPCPSCTALLDQLDGAAGHAAEHVTLAVAAKAPLDRVLTFAAERGWRRLRLLSSAGTSYNRDYLAEAADGSQQPMLNVFHRDGDTVRHFWGSELFYAPADPGQEPRHVGTIEPLWNLFDFTREGRPATWHEQFSY
jgi:predicted dithiol-disulfide oxidoreductase (DUF899 family)